MDDESAAGREARQAWERLLAWYRHFASVHRRGVSGDGALEALAEIGVVRRLLDQVEFETVRAARGQGKSWAEIALRLGVTRQSAWERWRDVDDAAGNRPDESVRLDIESVHMDIEEPGGEGPSGDEAAETMRGMVRGRAMPDEPQRPAAWDRRRRSTVRVPDVVGLARDEARARLNGSELRVISADPDGLPIELVGLPGSIVKDQIPESGAMVPRGSSVRLWLDGGGDDGPGVREPRRPAPDPRTARQMRDEATDEAVG
jgi:hypothetical protein